MKILKQQEVQRFTLGVAYSPGGPDEVDLQGDWATAETIELACWDYQRELQKSNGLNDSHVLDDGVVVGEVVENYILPADTDINGTLVKSGSWLIGTIWEPHFWQKVKDKERVGLSIEGRGRRIS